MTRIALTLIVVAAGVTAAVTHHQPRRPSLVQSDAPGPLIPRPLRVSRDQGTRLPLPVNAARPKREGVSGPHDPVVGRARPAGSGSLFDTTMYCATGNQNAAGRWPQLGDVAVLDRSIPFGARVLIAGGTYRVEDWVGWGSDFDIYGGSDPGCEQRALDYGRRRLRVVVER